jgi:hypothetical protein
MKNFVVFVVPLAIVLGIGNAQAQTTAKIGILSDMSGLYADIGGSGSVEAAKMAVENFDPAKQGMKVDVIAGDHLNRPDVGFGIARQWARNTRDVSGGSEEGIRVEGTLRLFQSSHDDRCKRSRAAVTR